ncbi:hypothetical protein V8V75_09450, partial [Peribacillus frigoritolerans]|uniref:hypothetical protein n=1 Tax=Peribacillus frigoritolerans TaxID=450367 RepID=UPI00300801C1
GSELFFYKGTYRYQSVQSNSIKIATIMLEIEENAKVVSERLAHSKSELFSRKLFKSSRKKSMDQ